MAVLGKSPVKLVVVAALLLALGSLAATGIGADSLASVTVLLIGDSGSPLSGVSVSVVNGTSVLGSAKTNSTGYAAIPLNSRGKALVVTSGPVGWVAADIPAGGSLVRILLNDTASFRRVNVTVYFGGEEGVLEINATFEARAPSGDTASGSLSGLKAPVFIYVPVAGADGRAVLSLPGSVKKLLVPYRLANVTVVMAGGSRVTVNATSVEVNATVAAVEVRYLSQVPLFLGLPLQTWIIMALVAALVGVVAVMVRARRAAQAVLDARGPRRRVIREYELVNGFNGLLEAIDSAPLAEKHRLARRILKRAD